MALYRYQAVCVGFWRGKVKRWNTTFHSNSSNNVATVKTLMSNMGYKVDGDVVGACSGGVASVTVYNAAGGAPIAQSIYFDWQAPGTWIPYAGTAWAGVSAGTPLDASGESAAVVMARLPGLSKTGKPMFLRKYFHAIPSRQEVDFSKPDISAAQKAAIDALMPNGIWVSPRGISTTSGAVDPWYLNHQRVRGRRRTTKQVAAQSFSAGVVTGAGASASDAEPFRG